MKLHAVRTVVVVVLLFGTFALAVPQASALIDRLLFATEADKGEKVTSEKTPLSPVNDPTPLQPMSPLKPTPAANKAPKETDTSPFAFQYDESSSKQGGNFPVSRTSLDREIPTAPTRPARDLGRMQRDLESLGAEYVVVEEISEGVFECRCLVPLATNSNYQKPFSAQSAEPDVAMEQVVERLRYWRSAAR